MQNGQCVFMACPAGYVQFGLECLLSCPAGYTPQNGQCVQEGGCIAGHVCQGNDLYLRSSNCSLSFVQACTYGCGGNACLLPPSPQIVTWTVLPTLVQKGGTTRVTWSATNVASCTVTGTNGDSWTGTSGSQTSSPLHAQTIFTITCQGFPGATPPTVTRSTTVNIVPDFHEE